MVRPSGCIALAGLIEAQAADIRGAYAPWFSIEQAATEEGWLRLSGTRLPA